MRLSLHLSSLVVAASVLCGASAFAHGSYATTWSTRYPGSSSLNNVVSGTGQNCSLCHFTVGGGSSWNAYGWKMRQGTQAGMSVLNAIIAAEVGNSDLDPTTATNLAEITAGAQPGWTPGAVNTRYNTSSTVANQSPPAIAGALDPTGVVSFCFGDGTGTACPCGNSGAVGSGCASSTIAAGGQLGASGTAGASAGTDTLVLTATNIAGPGLFFQGTAAAGGGAGSAFGDGLLCMGGTITRMGVVFPTGTTASYPGGLTPNPIHVAGATAPGNVRQYQCWYRDAAVFCSTSTFNLTQALALTWGP